MIVRVRDLVSALLLFPLALAGFFLGFGIAVLPSELRDWLRGNSSAKPASGSGSMDLSAVVILLILLLIPVAYFSFIRKQTRAYPHHVYFGELSAQVFIVLTIIAFVLPLLTALILMLVVF